MIISHLQQPRGRLCSAHRHRAPQGSRRRCPRVCPRPRAALAQEGGALLVGGPERAGQEAQLLPAGRAAWARGPPQAGAALCSFLSWAGVLGSTCRACVPELSAVSLLCFCSHPPPQHRRSPERLLSLRRFSLLPHRQFGPLLRYQHHPFFEGSSSGDLARGSLEKGGVGVPDLHLRPEALVGAHVPCKVVSATRTGVSCSLSVVWLN